MIVVAHSIVCRIFIRRESDLAVGTRHALSLPRVSCTIH
jgi:hypothetical protein